MHRRPAILVSLMLTLLVGGCEVVGGILQVGFWAGAVAVVLLIVVISLLVRAFRR